MIIVLINWRILPERRADFIAFWSSLRIENQRGFIGEFLSKVEDHDLYDKVNWEIEPSENEDKSFWKSQTYLSFVNVGLWDSLEDFNREIGPKMNPAPEWMNEFEAAPRRRAVLTPEAWRMRSESGLPDRSSEGVLD